MPQDIDQFRARLIKSERASGLSETAFAKKLGLGLTTYRAVKEGGAQGPALSTILRIAKAKGGDFVSWLLTGKEPEAQAAPKEIVRMDCPVCRAHNPLDRRPPDPGIITTLGMAWSILESSTTTAEALKLNVVEFYEKVFTPPAAQGAARGGQGPTADGAAVVGATAQKKGLPE